MPLKATTSLSELLTPEIDPPSTVIVSSFLRVELGRVNARKVRAMPLIAVIPAVRNSFFMKMGLYCVGVTQYNNFPNRKLPGNTF
jgi:hypothetical protein